MKRLWTCLVFSFGATVSVHGQFLILGAPSFSGWNSEVQSTLTATGLLNGAIDVYDAHSSTPTLNTLLGYQAILVYSDTNFNDPTTLGNELAAYVNAGGGVVIATFADSSTAPLGGNWNTGGYDPISLSSQNQGTQLTLGTVFDPGSPLMAGVTRFSGGSSSYRSTGTATANTQTIASWSDGEPLVVQKLGFAGRVIGLNFYPPSSASRSDFWTASTDGGILLANALNFVAVPEPSTLALLGAGLGLLAAWAWPRRRG